MSIRWRIALVSVFLLLGLTASAQEDDSAEPDMYGYYGAHPLPYDAGGGFCGQTGAHFHEFPPFDSHLFRRVDGYFYFTGPVEDFGYDGETWGYGNNHPVPVEFGGQWCFVGWPHRHPYAPNPLESFSLADGYYTYSGPFDDWYSSRRRYYEPFYGSYYRSTYRGGGYYRLRPEPIYRVRLTARDPGVYRAGANVSTPRGGSVVVTPPSNGGAPVRVGAAPSAGGSPAHSVQTRSQSSAPTPVGRRIADGPRVSAQPARTQRPQSEVTTHSQPMFHRVQPTAGVAPSYRAAPASHTGTVARPTHRPN